MWKVEIEETSRKERQGGGAERAKEGETERRDRTDGSKTKKKGLPVYVGKCSL